jgi:hypothetical protein
MRTQREDKVFSRRERIGLHVTPGEMADLRAVADAWDVKPTVVAWYLVATALAKMRRRNLKDIGYKMETQEMIDHIEGILEEEERDAGDIPPQGDDEAQQDEGDPAEEELDAG